MVGTLEVKRVSTAYENGEKVLKIMLFF